MPRPADPTESIRKKAITFPGVAKGTACTQSSFKAGKGGKVSFLFVGPGAKGIGFKAMFKLSASLPEARKLAAARPERFEAGSNGWVTARFTAEEPLPKSLWEKWLRESYDVTCGSAGAGPKRAKKAAKRVAKKAKKKTGRKR